MTWRARLFACFPGAVLGLAVACAVWLAWRPGPAPVVALLAVLYLLPVLAFRAHEALWPVKAGVYRLVGSKYVPWWGAHQTQALYLAFPALEAALRVLPGVYSAWLRLWGAKVGRGVYWTPLVEVSDRNLVEIGDGAVLGHKCGLYPHVIRPRGDDLALLVKRVRIGAGAFVGAGSVLGPGVVVEERAFLGAGSHIYPNTRVARTGPEGRAGEAAEEREVAAEPGADAAAGAATTEPPSVEGKGSPA